MKTSIKALLFSALIYPGMGHFYLKKPVPGILFASIATVCLYFLLVMAVKIAQEISDKILNGEIPFDILEMTVAIQNMLEQNILHQANVATISLLVCWLASIVDAYRLGRRKDREAEVI